jgi:transcriptional regulator with XRE-family HTH domain
MTLDEAVGQAVRMARESCDMTQAQLAERAGLHKMSLSKVERGLVSAKIGTLEKIAKALLPSARGNPWCTSDVVRFAEGVMNAANAKRRKKKEKEA